MSKLVFIGNIQWGQPSTGGGVQTKNQYFLNYIFNKTNDCKFYDTWGKSPIIAILSILFIILITGRNTPIILSISSRGPYYIAMIFHLIGLKRRCFYWVAGGDLAISLKNASKRVIRSYEFYEKIIVQCDYLEHDLEELGIKNCMVVPNFKPIKYTPQKHKQSNQVRFVFLSRILKEKGIDDIISALKLLKDSNISVDFYGSLCPPYNLEFFQNQDVNIQYKGFLDMGSEEGYDKLAQYDALLFPTYYVGEGFPGTLIDAFIAGLPAIVSDFHANPEVIKDMHNGVIIPAQNPKALSKAMSLVIDDPDLRKKMSKNAHLSAQLYEVNYVLDNAFKELKILN